jgi:N-acetylmuramoyl-L-alanine amidase
MTNLMFQLNKKLGQIAIFYGGVVFFVLFITSLLPIEKVYGQSDLKTIVIDPGHGGVDPGAVGRMSREAEVALKISLKVKDLLKKEMPELSVLLTRDKDILPGNLYDKNAALRWRANFANDNNADLFISIHLNASPGNQRYERKQVGTKEQTYYVYSGKGKSRKKIAKTRMVPVYERYRLEPTIFGTQTYILAADYYKGKVAAAGRASNITGYVDIDSLAKDEAIEVDPVEARIRAQQYAKYFFQKSLTLATFVEEEFGSIGRKSWGVWQRDWAGAQGIHVLSATQMPSILIETGFIDHWEEEEYLNSDSGTEEMAQSIVRAIKRYRDGLSDPLRQVQNGSGSTIRR